MRRLSSSFYERDPLQVAPDLLGKVLVIGDRAVRIVEVEAYRGSEDPASHAYRGRTKRNATMFGPPGHLYVYFTYGMHWCANVVCGPEGTAWAVLLRAGEPLAGIDRMIQARKNTSVRDLCRGPARLAKALGLDGSFDGACLLGPEGRDERSRAECQLGDPKCLGIFDDGQPPPAVPSSSGRVGIKQAVELDWRWWIPDSPYVSSARPSKPARPSNPARGSSSPAPGRGPRGRTRS
jgi:DNA-3-methyladenine glycosylase